MTPKGQVMAVGIEQGIEWTTVMSPMPPAVNGYVLLPEGHPWYGKEYDDIDVDVNGGLTYARDGWIGFDTLHMGDYWPPLPGKEPIVGYSEGDTVWTPDLVAAETRHLARQAAAAL